MMNLRLSYILAIATYVIALPQSLPQNLDNLSSSRLAEDAQRIVCISGQCLQGFTNASIGTTIYTTLTNPPISILLLPDTYTSSSNPKLLNQLLVSQGTTVQPFPGFESTSSSNGRIQLPMTVTLGNGGLALYSDRLYSGQVRFTKASPSASNSGTVLSGVSSLALAPNTWACLAGSGSSRIIVRASVPDISQLPSSLSIAGSNGSSLTLLNLQSSSCSPPCSSSGGICLSSPGNDTGTCSCKPNFTGSSCEQCLPNHFGPTCESQCDPGCPVGQCDDGFGGSGRCKVPLLVSGSPSQCNCLNGQCAGGAGSQCTCSTGWTTADNGTQCGKCASGFFLLSSSSGDQCKSCALGCTSCEDQTGKCITCANGFSPNANNPTQCTPVPTTKAGGVQCPPGSFGTAQSAQCTSCDSSCATCNGPSSADCLSCPTGSFIFGSPGASGGASCVKTDESGVCAGSNGQLIGDNVKKICDTCGPKCTQCQIPNFSASTSTADQLRCTSCLPGSVLFNGACLDSCPSGTFLDPKDNVTCSSCSSSCGSCIGRADFCTSCSQGSGFIAGTDGQCNSSTCPTGTFSPTSGVGQCGKCHPDCKTCSGPALSQCLSCSSSLPVLNGGRCLSTCPSPTQFFDSQSGQCLQCDQSCGSCAGTGKGSCLSCPDGSNTVLKNGQCVAAQCADGQSVLNGLGVCLSDIVTGSNSTLPDPVIKTPRKPIRLEWWQILLLALGCASIFLFFVLCWRRRRAKGKQQANFRLVPSSGFDPKRKTIWERFREKMKSLKPTRRHRISPDDEQHLPLQQKVFNSLRRQPTPPTPPTPDINIHVHNSRFSEGSSLSGPSLYTQLVREVPRYGPEPRQPIRAGGRASTSMSRYSHVHTISSVSSEVPSGIDWEKAKAWREKLLERTHSPSRPSFSSATSSDPF